MVNLNKSIKRICSFYVSDWHLITMLIPYLKEKVNGNNKIVSLFENSLEENINILMQKLILNKEDKEKINKINWKKSSSFNFKVGNNNKLIFIISGSREYIKKMNIEIEKILNIDITIINCFEVQKYSNNIKEILNEHKYVLNTSGEKKIEDVFEMYVS